MNFKDKLNQIRVMLGMQVKLEQMTLVDGAVVEAEAFEPEFSIGIVTEDGLVALPVGSYETNDGKVIVVEQEGVIASVSDKPAEEAPEEVSDVEAEAELVQPQPKQIKEIREINFASQEAMDILKTVVSTDAPELPEEKVAEIVEDLTEVIAQILEVQPEAFGYKKKEEEMQKVEMSAEPIVHNPENVKKVELQKYGKPSSIKENIYKQLFN